MLFAPKLNSENINLVLQLCWIFICLSAFGGLLTLVIPGHSPAFIGLGASVGVFAAAYHLGTKWNNQQSKEAKSASAWFILMLLFTVITDVLSGKLIRLVFQHHWDELLFHFLGLVMLVSIAYLPFYLGRSISSRRVSTSTIEDANA